MIEDNKRISDAKVKKRIKPIIGDVYCISLSNGKYAYAQFLKLDSHGDLLRISNRISSTPRKLQDIGDFSELRFSPVYVHDLISPLSSGEWTRIGNLPVIGYEPPPFKFSFSYSDPKDDFNFISIWNGKERVPIDANSRKLLPQYEMDMGYSYVHIEERILNGFSHAKYEPYEPKPNPFVDLDAAVPLPSSRVDKVAPRAIESDEEDEADGVDESERPSVLIHLDGVNLPDDIYEKYDLMTLEDKLIAKLEVAGFGELDGNEIGEGGATLFLYAEDAEKLYRAIKPVLRGYPLCRKARVAIFNGETEREEIIPG